MKTKFKKFVQKNWGKPDLVSYEWHMDELEDGEIDSYGTVLFSDGIELIIKFDGENFNEVEL